MSLLGASQPVPLQLSVQESAAPPSATQPAPQTPASSEAQSKGLDSAQAIAAIPREQFVQHFAPAVGGEAVARQIHQNATAVTAQTMLLWANVQNTVASPYFRAIRVNNVGNDIHQFETFPDYQELFGSLNYCMCDECTSIFGPAAYFVDLMRIIDQYITTPNQNSIDQHFRLDTRRPDLAGIELTCANTNDLVSFLEIVNHILACKLADLLQPNPSSPCDLTKAITTAYTFLAAATYPFNLPFNVPLAQIRSYLGQQNTDLASIYTTFNAPQEALAREVSGLSIEEYILITTPKPNANDLSGVYGVTVSASDLGGLANQDTFLKQTGLSRQDLSALLTQNLSQNERNDGRIIHTFYINQTLGAGQYLHLATDGSNTISNLDLATLDRLNRFIRLATKLGWSFADLDWILHSLGASEITPDTIQSIAKVKQVKASLKLPMDVLCSFWHDIKTIGVGDAAQSQALFDVLFNNPRTIGKQAPYHPLYQDQQNQPINPLDLTHPVLNTPHASS